MQKNEEVFLSQVTKFKCPPVFDKESIVQLNEDTCAIRLCNPGRSCQMWVPDAQRIIEPTCRN